MHRARQRRDRWFALLGFLGAALLAIGVIRLVDRNDTPEVGGTSVTNTTSSTSPTTTATSTSTTTTEAAQIIDPIVVERTTTTAKSKNN